MQKFCLLKDKHNDQFCFSPPNRLFQIENSGKAYKQSTVEELDHYSQNNLWPHIENRVKQIQLKLTNKCNCSCIHCLENASPSNNVFVNFNLLLPLIEDFSLHNKHGNIVLTGGEPLLHPDIHKIITVISNLNLLLSIR